MSQSRLVIAILCSAVMALAAASAATQWLAHVFAYQAALGAPLVMLGEHGIYPPSALLIWRQQFSADFPRPFAVADFIFVSGLIAAAAAPALILKRARRIRPFGLNAWARREDLLAAGLLDTQGAILGKFGAEVLAFDGAEHQLLVGASRSGKGRGHVVPTLLACPHSALVLDIKGELASGDPRHGFPGTAGQRALLGPVLMFAPTQRLSARFNPLFEVRRGDNEVRDIQNLMDVLFASHETHSGKDFWNRSAANIVAPVALHVLYSEPLERKTLGVVREKLRNLLKTADEMRRTLHRLDPATNLPQVHPEILHAAESFLAGEERMRSGVQATAESMFGIFADPLVAKNTQSSDFRLGDLMAHERPVTLYLQPPPGDTPRLMPLMRLIVDQIGRALMESQTHDSMGREKRHRLFLMLDEFPALGRLSFFETMMGAMAGYGLKVALVCQSLNHITRAYGRDNVIIDNCHIVSAYGAADIETAKRIADMAGETWEVRESETERRPRPIIGRRGGSSTWREERRPLLTPGDVRALARDEQLIFVAGAKPIRAKKLKFDQEGAFRARLRPFGGASEVLTVAHDWQSVRALGTIAPSAQTLRQPPTSSVTPATTGQGDLFEFVARQVSITDITRAKPSSAVAASKESDAKPKSKGI